MRIKSVGQLKGPQVIVRAVIFKFRTSESEEKFNISLDENIP
jgi:hypothetical protein